MLIAYLLYIGSVKAGCRTLQLDLQESNRVLRALTFIVSTIRGLLLSYSAWESPDSTHVPEIVVKE